MFDRRKIDELAGEAEKGNGFPIKQLPDATADLEERMQVLKQIETANAERRAKDTSLPVLTLEMRKPDLYDREKESDLVLELTRAKASDFNKKHGLYKETNSGFFEGSLSIRSSCGQKVGRIDTLTLGQSARLGLIYSTLGFLERPITDVDVFRRAGALRDHVPWKCTEIRKDTK